MKPNGWAGLLLQGAVLLAGLGAIYGKLASDMFYNSEAHELIRAELRLVRTKTDATQVALARLEEKLSRPCPADGRTR